MVSNLRAGIFEPVETRSGSTNTVRTVHAVEKAAKLHSPALNVELTVLTQERAVPQESRFEALLLSASPVPICSLYGPVAENVTPFSEGYPKLGKLSPSAQSESVMCVGKADGKMRCRAC